MRHSIQAVFTVMLTLGASTVILAVPSDVPGVKTCDDSDYTVYEQMKCQQDAIASQLEHTADVAFGPNTKMRERVNSTRLKQIKNVKEKAITAKGKNDEKMFKRLARAGARGNKGEDLGHLVPLDPDDVDGICDYEAGETCAAIELDADGNLQECNPKKKNKGKGKSKDQGGGNGKFDGLVCDRWFDSEDEEEELDMEIVALDLNDTLAVTQVNLSDMNNILEDVNATESSPSAVVFNAENGGCSIPSTNQHLRNSVIAMRVVHAVAEGAADTAENWCDQTIVAAGFGSNASTACTVLDIATVVANLAYISVEEAANDENDAVQMAIMDCVKRSADAVADLREAVEKLKFQMTSEHGEIMTNDDNNKTEIIQVLNTPHGQRDKHPKP